MRAPTCVSANLDNTQKQKSLGQKLFLSGAALPVEFFLLKNTITIVVVAVIIIIVVTNAPLKLVVKWYEIVNIVACKTVSKTNRKTFKFTCIIQRLDAVQKTVQETQSSSSAQNARPIQFRPGVGFGSEGPGLPQFFHRFFHD